MGWYLKSYWLKEQNVLPQQDNLHTLGCVNPDHKGLNHKDRSGSTEIEIGTRVPKARDGVGRKQKQLAV